MDVCGVHMYPYFVCKQLGMYPGKEPLSVTKSKLLLSVLVLLKGALINTILGNRVLLVHGAEVLFYRN